MTTSSEQVLARYVIEISGPPALHFTSSAFKESYLAYLAELEENINDLLPRGFHAQIKELDYA